MLKLGHGNTVYKQLPFGLAAGKVNGARHQSLARNITSIKARPSTVQPFLNAKPCSGTRSRDRRPAAVAPFYIPLVAGASNRPNQPPSSSLAALAPPQHGAASSAPCLHTPRNPVPATVVPRRLMSGYAVHGNVAVSVSAVTSAAAAEMPARLRLSGNDADRLLPPPPCPPLAGSEAGSFAEATITVRLPAILESMIRDVEADMAEAERRGAEAAAQVSAGLLELRALRQSMLINAPLQVLQAPGAPEPTQVLLDSANACVQLASSRLKRQHQQGGQQQGEQCQEGAGPALDRPTWLDLPWLVVECYLYAAIQAALQRHPALAGHDPFSRQKAAAWTKSTAAAAEMAGEVELLLRALAQSATATAADTATATAARRPSHSADETSTALAAARAAALAGMQMALWGNKADLSLLVNAAGLEGLELSTVADRAAEATDSGIASAVAGAGGGESSGGGDAMAAAALPAPSRVIVDDGEAVWAVMAELRRKRHVVAEAEAAGGGGGGGGHGGSGSDGGGCSGVRVDIVLDNSGLELFADLCLADLLMEAGVSDLVVLHGKPIPWFVSDTLASDLEALLASCEAEAPPSSQVPTAAWQPVRRLAARWRAHLASGRWRWEAHPFWCTPAPFCWMAAAAPDLYGSLAASGLVVFKGDLNYRKLTHDCRWPHTTPFETALQGFRPAPLLALRTLKADVVAGLALGQSAVLSSADPDWLVNGKWGMIQAAL